MNELLFGTTSSSSNSSRPRFDWQKSTTTTGHKRKSNADYPKERAKCSSSSSRLLKLRLLLARKRRFCIEWHLWNVGPSWSIGESMHLFHLASSKKLTFQYTFGKNSTLVPHIPQVLWKCKSQSLCYLVHLSESRVRVVLRSRSYDTTMTNRNVHWRFRDIGIADCRKPGCKNPQFGVCAFWQFSSPFDGSLSKLSGTRRDSRRPWHRFGRRFCIYKSLQSTSHYIYKSSSFFWFWWWYFLKTRTMMTDTGLPVMNKPVNAMEAGPNGNNLQAQALPRHPVELLQQRQGTSDYVWRGTATLQVHSINHVVIRSHSYTQIPPSSPPFVFLCTLWLAAQRVSFLGSDEEEEVRHLYGSGLAMTLATERRMAHDLNSMAGAGLVRSNFMTDILTGTDMKLGFEDVLNLPQHRPIFHRHLEDPHADMERKLGMMM